MKHRRLISRVATCILASAMLIVLVADESRAAAFDMSADPAIATVTSVHTIDAHLIPQERYAPTRHRPGFMPDLLGTDEMTWRLRKEAARYNRAAPFDPRPMPAEFDAEPFALTRFAGMSDSASTCPYFGGCQPPDMAIAASSSFVVQGVNTSMAVYKPDGTLMPGWPKDSNKFFGIPAPGWCSPNGPFTSDPRAFYDPIDGRFWVTMLEIEGPIINQCGVVTKYWVAVSATGDPTGSWHIYSFNMWFHTANIADYTQIGFDKTAFYFGGNMFDDVGQSYMYDEIFAADKSKMEAGATVKQALGFMNIKVGGVLIDTLQPVLVEDVSPSAGLFIDSFNMNSGGGSCTHGCSGINLFAMANPLTKPSLSHATVASKPYAFPPLASQPGSPNSLETIDTRITGTPVYRNGSITFALETAVNNGTNIVPGIMWGQVSPTFSGLRITGGTMRQNAVLSFSGDRAASFGAIMTDSTGDALMVFDSMSSTINPGIYYVSRFATDPQNRFGHAKLLMKGIVPTIDSRWGDYEATSWDGAADNIWFSSEYSNTGGDWATVIGRTKI